MMKKMLLLAVSATLSAASFAQQSNLHGKKVNGINNTEFQLTTDVAAKGTAVGDTLILSHFGSADVNTVYSYPNDTGYAFGINAFGSKGYAERYDVHPADSTIQVLGVAAWFTGSYNPSTTKTVTFNVWAQGPKTVSFRPTLFNNGLPTTSLASGSRSITQLGVAATFGDPDTTKAHVFATPTAYLTDSFFVGYTIDYTWTALAGDTIGLVSNQDGDRTEPAVSTLAPGDTTVNNTNAIMTADGAWSDLAARTGLLINLAVYPIVKIGPGTGSTHGVTRKDFTFFGAYPNPANNSTNVKIALANTADVSIQVMDVNGKYISTSTTKGLSAGEHVIALNTSDLATGEYIYIVRTSTGNGVASKLQVIR